MWTKCTIREQHFKGWKGPGVVLGQEGQSVLVRRAGSFYWVHPCQLMKVKESGSSSQSRKK